MAIQFDFYETPTPNKNKEKEYHPRVVNSTTLGSDELLKQISHRCTLTKGDVKACLTELSHSLTEGLRAGRNVHLEGVGYFSTKLICTAEKTTPHTRSEYVKVKGIAFRPEREIRQELTTAELERAKRKSHSTPLTNQEIESCIEQHFSNKSTLTRAQLEELCQLTKTTALKHINRMVQQQKLVNLTNRHQALYAKPK
ncbi:MAG: HU family DNA-binding protein [Phocaeicola sp.]